MTMRNPAMAVLWESWRLSRPHLARSLFLAVFGGAVLIASPIDRGAMWMLMLAGFLAWTGFGWVVNVDSRKGFSMALGFARPIPTWMLVSVPMAYVGITCAVTYLVYALVLQAALGISFPLLPVAALVGTLSVATVAFNWWRPSGAVRVAFGASGALLLLYSGDQTAENDVPYAGAMAPDRWPELFAYSAWTYVWMALISAAAIAVTIAAVARQRRGDDGFTLALPTRRSANKPPRPTFRAWIADRLRGPCPTSSPTRAQLWLEVYTVGGRVLATGVLMAFAAPVVIEVAGFRSVGVILGSFMLWGFLSPLIVGLRSLLGVRRKQGISYLSAFTATRAMGTGRLIGLKVLVTSVAMLGAWAAIGTSLWLFAERLAVWGPEAQVVFAEYQPGFIPSLSPTAESLSAAASMLVYVIVAVAAGGAFNAFLLLNKKRVILAGLGLALYITLLVVAGVRGWIDAGAIATSHLWFVTGAVFLGAITLFRHTLAERIFTPRGFTGILVLWAAFAALLYGWLNPWLNPTGVGADGPSELDAIAIFVLMALLPLAVLALSPWSFGRIRHR